MKGHRQPSDASTNLQRHLDVNFALQAAGLGLWEYKPTTGLVNWDERARALFGIAKGHEMPYEQAIRHIHPDDVQQVNQAVQRALNPQSDGLYDQTYRTIGVDDGQLRWVRFQGRSYFDQSGDLERFGGIAQEVTQQILAQEAIEQSQYLSQFEQAPVGIAIISGDEFTFRSANPFYGQIVGRSPEQLVGKTLFEAIPDVRGLGFDTLLRGVMTTGEPYTAQEVPAQLIRQGRSETAYFTFTYQPMGHNGTWSAILMIATEVTDQVLARRRLEENEAHLQLLRDTVPAMIFYLDAEQRYKSYNKVFKEWFGVGDEVIGKSVREFLGEQAYQVIGPHLAKVYGGQPERYELHAPTRMNADRWLSIVYTPHITPEGQVIGVIVHATDITQGKQTERVLQASEARFRLLIEEAPVATCLFVGRELRIEVANEAMLSFWGKGNSVLGKPLEQAVPELVGQPFLDILDQVFTTGQTYTAHHMRADLEVDGILDTYYFDFTYKPLRNAAGEVYAIMDMATDVTQQVKAQQLLLESESSLGAMIDLAELGRYTIDLATNSLVKSPRLAEWYGLPEQTTVAASLGRVQASDQERVRQLFAAALIEGSSGVYDAEYGVISARTGQRRLLRTTGQVRYDADGRPTRVEGLVIDLTRQRELQWKLEEQVNQRTQELAIANEALQASNEKMALSNQALAQANQDLKRSNDNLQQFAYVASHDLQEPLRKIQSFSTLLDQHMNDQLDEMARSYLERITRSGARMSTLIKDLLSYSRIATRQQFFGPISLNAVMVGVLETLSLEIEERQAQIQLDELPIVNGDNSQLSQLFQNLLSNALKFTPLGQAPQVHVEYFQRQISELPAEVRPNREASFYHQISVRDHGVGFDMKYLDRIFQVFQRLHGKNEFAGTGVGLAICQRVVENHGGAITADSQPGEGATFCVYLPA